MLHPGQIIISAIHLPTVTQEYLELLLQKRVIALAYEYIQDESDSFPIVSSMSEIAGSAVMLIAGQYLSKTNNGKGVLVGGISGIPPTKVIIIGAGIVGEYAARAALALGASVKVFDNSVYRLKRLQNNIGQRMWTSVIEPRLLAKQLKTCEVAVGALGTVYALSASADNVHEALTPLIAGSWGMPTALSLLAWFVFAPQCMSTIAVTRRETNGWKWPGFMLAIPAWAWWAVFFVVPVVLVIAASFGSKAVSYTHLTLPTNREV